MSKILIPIEKNSLILDVKNTAFPYKYIQDIVPARIVLLVTLCLVLINMFNSTT